MRKLFDQGRTEMGVLRRLKVTAAGLALGFALCGGAQAQVEVLASQSFEGTTGYTLNPAASSDDNDRNYYGRFNLTDGTQNANGLALFSNGEYDGRDGDWVLAARDMDAAPVSATEFIATLDPVNVAGKSTLKVRLLVGYRGNTSYRAEDVMEVRYSMDGGATTVIGRFEQDADTADPDDSNESLLWFDDLDGDAHEPCPLTGTMNPFTFDIPVTGNSVTVSVRFGNTGSNADISVDLVEVVSGGFDPEFPLGHIEPQFFGSLTTGTALTRTIAFENPGPTRELTVTTVTLTGDPEFTVVGDLPTSVPVGQDAEIQLRFAGSPGVGDFDTQAIVQSLGGNDIEFPAYAIVGMPFPFHEPFDYPAGDLRATTPTIIQNAGNGANNPIQVLAGSLVPPDPSLTTAGNKASMGNFGDSDQFNLFFSDQVGSGAYYLSFLLNVTQAPTAVVETGSQVSTFIELRRFDASQTLGTLARAGMLGINGTGNASTYALSFTTETRDPDVPTVTLNVGQTYFIVLKYEIVDGPNNDVTTVWVDPTPESFIEGAGATATITLAENTSDYDEGDFIATARFIQSDNTPGALFQIDEIRVSDVYDQVTGVEIVNRASWWMLYGE